MNKIGSRLYVCYPIIDDKQGIDKSNRKCFSTEQKAQDYMRGVKCILVEEPCATETLRSLQQLESSRGEW